MHAVRCCTENICAESCDIIVWHQPDCNADNVTWSQVPNLIFCADTLHTLPSVLYSFLYSLLHSAGSSSHVFLCTLQPVYNRDAHSWKPAGTFFPLWALMENVFQVFVNTSWSTRKPFLVWALQQLRSLTLLCILEHTSLLIYFRWANKRIEQLSYYHHLAKCFSCGKHFLPDVPL